MKKKVFIDGSEGTTGLRINERFEKRDDIEILHIPSELRKDPEERRKYINESDITFLCLPDAASKELAEALPEDVRVIDTSTAHRTDPDWVYGMPELEPAKREEIRNASRVANPGCHATGFILLARPLIDAGLIAPDKVLSCFCVTGYSGGGRKMIEDYDRRHGEGMVVSPSQYALGQSHKHLPEMKKMSGLEKEPVFCPVVGDYYRGMVMTIELPEEMICKDVDDASKGSDTVDLIRSLYKRRYENEPLISITDGPDDGFLYSDTMGMSDRFEIMTLGNSDRILLISRFDNLGKGASGAAIQNMNLLLGVDESTGLIL